MKFFRINQSIQDLLNKNYQSFSYKKPIMTIYQPILDKKLFNSITWRLITLC